MAKTKNIGFLFGSGISLPAKLISVDALTQKIINGKIVYGGSRFFEVEYPTKFSWDSQNEYVKRIRKLFEIIKKHLGSHYSFYSRGLNYEDYYYIIDSLHEDESMNFENPVVNYFSEYLIKDHAYLFDPIEHNFSRIRLIDLCSKAKDFINDIVTFNLSKAPSNLTHLNFLKEAFNEDSIENKFIFTLNHDTMLEQFFNSNKIKYSDGFKKINEEVKIWDKNYFKEKISLLKLHGSVNWHYESSNDWYEDKVCIYSDYVRDASRPLIQIGSFNKIHQYNRGINFQIHCLFSRFLEQVNEIIISGYSFGDQGINSRIIDWFFSNRDKRIIVIHPDPESLKKSARPAISGKWDNWLKSKSLAVIPKFIQNVAWPEIKNLI